MHTAPPVPDLMESLEDFADRVAAIVSNEDTDWLWKPDEVSWSLSEVMCHLRDVEQEVHLPRYRAVIVEDKPFLSGVDSDNWAALRAYHAQDGRKAAQSFLDLRGRSLALLNSLDYEQWQRTASHAFFGITTLHELVNLATQHDQAHWQQIQELLAGLG